MSLLPNLVDPSRIVMVEPRRQWSVADLRGDVSGWRARVALGGVVALRSSRAAAVGAALVTLDGWASAVHLLPSGVDSSILPEGVPVLVPEIAETPQAVEAGRDSGGPTQWIVYTSGTTGAPQAITHTVASLTRTTTISPRAQALTWGMLYDPNRMAGLQVVLQALVSGATLVAPDPHQSLAARVRWMRDRGVSALSATPTLWRQILQIGAGDGWPLHQITLGGEIADQKLLDALPVAFPSAHVTHVFASTETGAAFAVGDGRAGFPVSYLDDPPRGIAVRIIDGILHVQSLGVTSSDAGGFASTGDVVEIVGDRVMFRGRDSGVVNVGGAKVWPEEVERVLRTHPQVIDAVVTAKPNPFSGYILTACIVPAAGAPDDLAKEVRRWVKEHAPSHYVPASVTIAPSLGITHAGKAERR